LESCDWCGEENDDKITLVLNRNRYNICVECMNLYGNQEFEKLKERTEKAKWKNT